MSTRKNTMTNQLATPPVAAGVTPEKLKNLFRWNLTLGFLHIGQAIVIGALAIEFTIGVLVGYVDGPPEAGLSTLVLSDSGIGLSVPIIVTFFLALAGLDHLITATIGRKVYERDLMRGVNRFRWVEYALSSSAMVILISAYWGIITLNALVAILGANVAMILFGYLQEEMNPPGRTKTTMLPFWFGAFVGVTPWVAMGINVPLYSDAPEYIFVILYIQAVLFFCFALNQWLQYRQVGKWNSYAFGEKTYLVLSLIAKSLLAWQVYAASLIPGS